MPGVGTDRFKSVCGKHRTVTTSFDLFGTLVDAQRPETPAAAVADALDADPAGLRHVGDDPAADGDVEAVGGRAVLVTEADLADVPDLLEVPS